MAAISKASTLSRCATYRQLGSYSSVRFLQTTSQSASYPLYPSVAHLLREQNIPATDVSKIPATGPKGRLLKGDVLSYVGAIAADYPSNLASQINKLAHLDLSNIKLAPPPTTPQPEQQGEKEKAPEKEAEIEHEPTSELTIALPISFSNILSVQRKVRASVGVSIPLTTFVARAAEMANDDLPRASKPAGSKKASSNELFDEILGHSPQRSSRNLSASRGTYVPEITSPVEYYSGENEGNGKDVKQTTDDIIDVLSGRAPSHPHPRKASVAAAEGESEDPTTSIFSLTVPETEGDRAEVFLDKMQNLLEDEPAKLLVL